MHQGAPGITPDIPSDWCRWGLNSPMALIMLSGPDQETGRVIIPDAQCFAILIVGSSEPPKGSATSSSPCPLGSWLNIRSPITAKVDGAR
jgi:hypothetical protein